MYHTVIYSSFAPTHMQQQWFIWIDIAATTSWINIMNKFTTNKRMKQLQDDNGDHVH